MAVDFYDNLIVYAGNTVGDILKSGDGGIHWQVIKRFDSKIFKIMIDPSDSRIIYVATSSKGIFKTIDSGANWLDINDGLKPYSGAFEYRSLIFNPSESNSLILAAKYGLIKTNDGGQTWEALQLITPPATTDIFAVAVSPENSKEMYYTTSTTFYKTIDGGQNWITKRLPTLAIPSSIIINPNYPGVMYMGITSSPRR